MFIKISEKPCHSQAHTTQKYVSRKVKKEKRKDWNICLEKESKRVPVASLLLYTM